MLDWSFASGVGSVEASESAEQSGDDGDDLSAVGDVGGGLFEDEESGFGVDTERYIVSKTLSGRE